MKIILTENELHAAIFNSLSVRGIALSEDVEIRIVAGRGANGSYAEIDTDSILSSSAEEEPPFEPDPVEEASEPTPTKTKKAKKPKPVKEVAPEPDPEPEEEEAEEEPTPEVEDTEEPESEEAPEVSPDESALFD
jgi:outer membrane biosynthesis protein TonB